jgi:CRP-like cAMP-binding protein
MLADSRTTSETSTVCREYAERGFSLCKVADKSAARALASQTRVARFAGGSTIFAQGEPADRIGILTSGTVKVVDLTENGVAHILSLLSAGDIIGDIGSPENQLGWEAATDVMMCWLTRASFERLLADHASLQKGYLAAIVRQLEKERLWTSSMRSRGTLQRVASWLFVQVPPDRGLTETLLPLSLSRRDIASLLDMSPETLCRVLHTIIGMGAIRMPTPDLVVVQSCHNLLAIAKGVRSPLPDGMIDATGVNGSRSSGQTVAKINRPSRGQIHGSPGAPSVVRASGMRPQR